MIALDAGELSIAVKFGALATAMMCARRTSALAEWQQDAELEAAVASRLVVATAATREEVYQEVARLLAEIAAERAAPPVAPS